MYNKKHCKYIILNFFLVFKIGVEKSKRLECYSQNYVGALPKVDPIFPTSEPCQLKFGTPTCKHISNFEGIA
jgi:hypothetical protein